ncbi:MAG: hypothetical protein ACFFCS_14010, partial [Candidatus Hodarchaeota archaeon]
GDMDFLYIFIGIVVLSFLLPITILLNRDWSLKQLSIGSLIINVGSAIISYAFLFDMPEIDIRWRENPSWNPFASVEANVFTSTFILFQGFSLIFLLAVIQKYTTLRTITMQDEVGIIPPRGFFISEPARPNVRSDMVLTAVFLFLVGIASLLARSGIGKYYLLVSVTFQILVFIMVLNSMRFYITTVKNLSAKPQFESFKSSEKGLHPVPGRIGFLFGYLFLFLATSTQFIQKSDAGRDVVLLTGSYFHLLLGIASAMVLYWVLGVLGANSHVWRFFLALGVESVIWVVALLEFDKEFIFFEKPLAWLGAGFVIGLILVGVWTLFWPLSRWRSRRGSITWVTFFMGFFVFANCLIEINLADDSYDIFLYVFLAIVLVCVNCGIGSALRVFFFNYKKRMARIALQEKSS